MCSFEDAMMQLNPSLAPLEVTNPEDMTADSYGLDEDKDVTCSFRQPGKGVFEYTSVVIFSNGVCSSLSQQCALCSSSLQT